MTIASEIDAEPCETMRACHRPPCVEESLRIVKSHLEAKPAFAGDKNAISRLFPIRRLALDAVRALEVKAFNVGISDSGLGSLIRRCDTAQCHIGPGVRKASRRSETTRPLSFGGDEVDLFAAAFVGGGENASEKKV